MTGDLLRELTNNVAPLLGLVILHSVLLSRLQRRERVVEALFGALFGAVAVLGMTFPFELHSGTIFDGRTVVLALGAFFGGPLVAAIAALCAGAYRVWLGGTGMWVGLGTIATAAAFGLAGRVLLRRQDQRPRSGSFLTLGFCVHLAALLWMLLLPAGLRAQMLAEVAAAYLVVLTLSTWVFGHAFQVNVSRLDALREAEEAEGRFRSLVEGSPMGVYVVQNGRITYANAEMARMFGRVDGQLAGVSVEDIVVPEERLRVRVQVRAALTGVGQFAGLQFQALRADGSQFRAEMFGSRTRREGRMAIVGMLMDVTERERDARRLARSERLLRQAQQAGRIGSYVLDVVRGRWTTSEVLNTILGVTEEMPDTLDQWFAMIAPEHRTKMMAEGQRILREESHFSHEYQIVRPKDGRKRWVSASGEVERDAEGRPLRVVGVMRDITDRKFAEQALERSEALHRQAQRVARLGHWEMDHASGTLTLSEQTYLLWERDRSQWQANYRSFLASLHPDDQERVDCSFAAALVRREPFVEQYRLAFADGRIRHIETHGETTYAPGGHPLRTIGTVQDVSERIAAQADLARELANTRMMLETMTDGYIRTDVDGRILDTNPAYCRMLGYGRDEIVGRKVSDFKAPGRIDEVPARIGQILAAGQARFSTRHRHKGGQYIDIEASAVALPDAHPPQLYAFFRDVTLERRAEAHYKELVNRIPAGVFRYRARAGGGHFEYLSPACAELLDVDLADALRDPAAVFGRLGIAPGAHFDRPAGDDEAQTAFAWEGRLTGTPSDRWLQVEAGSSVDDDGDRIWHGIVSDVTVRQQLLERLRLDSAVIASTFESIMVTELDGTIISVNPAFAEITGYPPDEVIGRTPSVLKSGRHDEAFYQGMYRALDEVGHWQGQVWNRRKSGEIYPELLNISVVRDPDGRRTHYVGVATDISQIKRSEERLLHLAHHDALTGLPNRLLLGLRLEHAIERARRHDSKLAVLFLDLDRFKNVNDSLGHEVGDQLLLAVAERLRGLLREEDTLGRLGGDEFLMLLDQVDSSVAAAKRAEQVLAALGQPFSLKSGHELYVQASVGICMFPADGDRVELLIRNADTAMFRAKESGRNTYQFYTEAQTQAASERLALETRIRQAVRDGVFEVWYQPIYHFADRRLVGAEALLRWPDGERFISPDVFIPVAEDSGLIVEIGQHVLQTACADLRHWLDDGLDIELLAINLSMQQFRAPRFEQQLAADIRAAGVPASVLELEITERGLMDLGPRTLRKLDTLKSLGVRVAIDDFGTGYSSLTYLKRMPVDKLKIDRSFVRDLPQDTSDAAIVHTIVAIARTLGLKVLAEGVERADQLAFLRNAGCDECQGFLFGRAVPAETFAAQLREQKLPADA